jgi:PTH1 family peptidyl-tRNA hydrolase
MRLFVGLGNPGTKYQGNRHNIGFMVVDEIARRHGFAPWRRRFQGETSEGALAGERVILLKPATYMNLSGNAVQDAAQFFKVGGGIAGHNGLRSISAHIGNEYRRVRLGVGHPGVKELVHAHVLNDFAKSERPWVEALVDVVGENAALLVAARDSAFQNKVHLAMQAKGFVEKDDKEDNGGK